MKKIFITLTAILLLNLAYAHNPLQGTQWELKNEQGELVARLNFSHNSGTYVYGTHECSFTYNADHTRLYMKMNECDDTIFPCCDQQTLPFHNDSKGNLIVVINEQEFVFEPVI